VDSLIQQFLGLLEDSSSQNYDSGRTISDFVVLRG
jgi:hypothetical protein